jgi:hypothetical protein|tara:strand:- start:386 stop:715 length:330 start_codon:yes stop_codon:yes gene_type:complete
MFDLFFITFLILSFLLNIFLLWYCRNLMISLYDTAENMQALVEEAMSFSQHLNSVHELEVFYGDETLGNLIRHSKGFIDTLEDFAEIYTLFDQEAEEQLTEEVPDDADA